MLYTQVFWVAYDIYHTVYSGDHAPLEYIALHSIVLQCTVYTQVSNGTIDDSRIFFEGLFLRILLEKIFQFHILVILVIY